MKLWKAILKGSKLKPQGTGRLFHEQATCALGAGLDGLGGLESFHTTEDALKILSMYYPYLNSPVSLPIEIRDMNVPLSNAIMFLNDSEKWSREAIAEFVKTIENEITQKNWDKRKERRNKCQSIVKQTPLPAEIRSGVRV